MEELCLSSADSQKEETKFWSSKMFHCYTSILIKLVLMQSKDSMMRYKPLRQQLTSDAHKSTLTKLFHWKTEFLQCTKDRFLIVHLLKVFSIPTRDILLFHSQLYQLKVKIWRRHHQLKFSSNWIIKPDSSVKISITDLSFLKTLLTFSESQHLTSIKQLFFINNTWTTTS